MIDTAQAIKTLNFDQVFHGMEGWCKPHKAQRLFDLVNEVDAKVSVELGVFGGRSLIAMGIGHREKGSGFVIGIDPWNNKACLEGNNDPANDNWWLGLDMKMIYDSCQHHILKNELTGFCETLRFRSVDVAILFPNDSIDILHQDGNHNTTAIMGELRAWVPKLKMGGYWIADDTEWPQTQEGYSALPQFGLELVETHTYEDGTQWQIWKKIK